MGDREASTLTIGFADAGARLPCPPRVSLYERAGAIDAVVAWTGGARTGDAVPIPDVVGLDLATARDRVTAAGYPVRVEQSETCDPRSGVVDQAPTQQAVEDDREGESAWHGTVTLTVEVPHTTRDCAGLDAAAKAFLRFARGGAPPAWAPEVQQLLGYTLWTTISASAADDRLAWSMCGGVAPQDCEVSAVAVAGRDREVETGEYSDLTRWPSGEPCELIDRGGLPASLRLEQQIVLYPADLTSCEADWSVSLWIDDEGRIAAVNLLVPADAANRATTPPS